ncbi:TetR/AcrR family transcriptional regulator [Lysobacter sp. SG-8]|uniref:TetR/AcrR family transcriptional regulator n=1 Tax=Marilutibacter penaei TaxID=2759900 RepID=A0A7W3YD86_9GAMM|nr:TetR/AcrR family transcriptional regulator [Lysobacter penaei]MBB1086911.1 TetR/AcrR family transcriptional regulator [Lysobacter penaei]
MSSQHPTRPAGPGRPKDPAKRAAILEAAKGMFTQHGFAGASMEQIAAEAGVSKLTVYSHFGDKEGLFAAAVKAHCEQSLPTSLFEMRPDLPIRTRLLEIADAFYAMITTPEAVAGHRMMCSPQMADSPLTRLFWEAGPMRVQADFAQLLRRRIEAGELDIDDVDCAASQFFTLLKGEPHAQLVFGCCKPGTRSPEAHLRASVDMFLRAYGRAPRT